MQSGSSRLKATSDSRKHTTGGSAVAFLGAVDATLGRERRSECGLERQDVLGSLEGKVIRKTWILVVEDGAVLLVSTRRVVAELL